MNDRLRELQDRLLSAKSVSVLTGAGISAESGIPTFRKDGKPIPWRNYDDPTVLSHVDSLANIEAVWSWYGYRRRLIRQAEPNAGHIALAEWQRRLAGFTLITQNVDGLHQRAGSTGVVELHGNIWRAGCMACGRVEYHTKDEVSENVPYCSCGSPLRPGVVMFGEALDPATIAAAQRATACDVFLVIGTSALVWPAAGLATEARRRGAFLVEINPEATGLTDDVDLALQGAAGEVLHRIVG
jgi:NAD-dependent deacetylase